MPGDSRFPFVSFVLLIEFLFVFLKLLFLFLIRGNEIGWVKLLLFFRSWFFLVFLLLILLLKYLLEIGVVRRQSTKHKSSFYFLFFLFLPLLLFPLVLLLNHEMVDGLLFLLFLFLLFFLPVDELLKTDYFQLLFGCMLALLIWGIHDGNKRFFEIVGLLYWGLFSCSFLSLFE